MTTEEKVTIVYVFGGDVESILGVFNDQQTMLQAMQDNLATWNLGEGETIGEPKVVKNYDDESNIRTVYPVMVDGEEYDNGSCYSCEEYVLNKARTFE